MVVSKGALEVVPPVVRAAVVTDATPIVKTRVKVLVIQLAARAAAVPAPEDAQINVQDALEAVMIPVNMVVNGVHIKPTGKYN